jgi:hypothetical protein
MAKREWNQAMVDELEQRIRAKVRDGAKLTCGENVAWGVLKNGKPLEIRFVEEVDFMMGFDE